MKRYKLSPSCMGKIDVIKTLAKPNLGRVHIFTNTDELTTTITCVTGKHEIDVFRSMEPMDSDQIAGMIDAIQNYLLEKIIIPAERKEIKTRKGN